jgi:hypothetical protein
MQPSSRSAVTRAEYRRSNYEVHASGNGPHQLLPWRWSLNQKFYMDNVFITPAITIAGGLVVFGATQLAQRFSLDPVTDLMKALGRTAYVVTYYANVYASPGVKFVDDRDMEASKELRKCASELVASLRAVRFFWFFCLLRQIPSKECVEQMVKLLIGLSNVSAREDARSAWAEANDLKRLLAIR